MFVKQHKNIFTVTSKGHKEIYNDWIGRIGGKSPQKGVELKRRLSVNQSVGLHLLEEECLINH